MSYLHSLPPDAGFLRIFQAFPETARPLLEYHDVLIRGDSAFTAGNANWLRRTFLRLTTAVIVTQFTLKLQSHSESALM